MNYKLLGKILGKIMIIEGILMLGPFIVSLVYGEGVLNAFAFIIPIVLLAGLGVVLQLPKPKRSSLYQKEGFALVALAWIVMTLFGALPFVINGDIPNYIDACFEIMSGFTTTGASIIENIGKMSNSTLFWRSFSHWIGGMGILAFVLIFIPESEDGSSMHLLRAESPGPQVGKMLSKMKLTTGILYLIYFGLTVLEVILLMFDEPIAGYEGEKFFFSLLATFGTAGTGGFGFIPGSMELYSAYSQYVIATFLYIFGINFGLYYLLLIGKIKDVIRSEELRTYVMIVVIAVGLIFLSLVGNFGDFPQDYTTEEAFRHSYFQVASIMTTAGYSTTDFNLWPNLALSVIIAIMLFGGMAGSTAGGMKLSRLVIAVKGIYISIRKLINPRYVPKAKFEGKTLEEKTISDVFAFITMYFMLFFVVVIILCFDPVNGTTVVITPDAVAQEVIEGRSYSVTHGMFSNISATLACISNIGPGLEAVGPYASFAGFSWFSKIVLTLTMLIGRLEILPVLILFSPSTWKKA